MTFGPIFFPCQWDWDLLLPRPMGLCSLLRRYFANARKSLPTHRIPPNLSSTIFETIRLSTSAENNDVCCLNSRIRGEAPSIVFPFAKHTRYPQILDALPTVCVPLRDDADTLNCYHALHGKSKVRPSTKKHQRLPTNSLPYSPSSV